MKCYISQIEITDENKTEEHIIQQFLGGELKSKDILIDKINNELGRTIDKELSKQIRIGDLIGIRRDRGGSGPKIVAKTEEGVKYEILKGKKVGIRLADKPKEYIDEEGKYTIEVSGSKKDQNKFLKNYKKKNPLLTEEQIEKQITEIQSNEDIEVFPEGNIFSLISGEVAYRAIAKIAANYYVHITKDITFASPLVPFIYSGEYNRKLVYNYYHKSRENINLKPDEVSHYITIVGDYSERILYAYIELFNVYSFLVIINDEYDGPNQNFFYRYDLLKSIEIEGNLNLEISSTDVRNLDAEDLNEKEGFKERLSEFLKINGYQMIKAIL